MQATRAPSAGLVAALVSEAVRPHLDRAGRSTVHSVFRSAVNLQTEIGLLTVCGPEAGRLPNGISLGERLDFRTLGVRPGPRVVIDARRVTIPMIGLEIDLTAASTWDPRVTRIGGPGARERWRGRSAWVRDLTADLLRAAGDPQAGFGSLLVPGSLLANGPSARLAWPRLDRLSEALRHGDRQAARAAAASLVGLGPGLTPSGDDALVGAAAASAALTVGGRDFLRAVAQEAPDRTTIVASTFLRHAAAGEFAGRLHDLLGVLLGTDADAVPAAIELALAWGATSGADTLVGVLLGLDALSGVPAAVARHAA